MNLGKMFEFSVKRFPENIAIVEDDRRYTYREFNSQINKLAVSLQRLGIKRGDRVVLVLKNRLETVAFYWAVQKIGAVFTPINFRFSTEEVTYCVNNAEAKVVIYEPISEDAVLDANYNVQPLLISILDAKGGDTTYEKMIAHEDQSFQQPEIDMNDICLMLYTSGTTGKPKGVPRTHLNEYSAATAHIIQNSYSTHESTIGAMPLYHTMGMRSLVSMGLLNGKFVMIHQFNPENTLEVLEKEKITCIYLIPTVFHDIVNHRNFDKYNLENLKRIGYAGAAMTTELTEKCIEKFKPEVFVNHYGSTEVYTFSICNYLDKKPGCAGKAGFHQELRLVTPDPEGNADPNDFVSTGEPGEIIVNINSLEAFKGYWKRPDADKKSIRSGWYFTGDMGVLDEDGDLHVVGRVDDMIISGGENIHPLEVEDVLSTHPDVKEVTIVGIPDSRWGEKVVAYIVSDNKGLTPEVLDTHCKNSNKLANFKRPREYCFVNEIPKSQVGKILRRVLKENYEEMESV